MSTGAVRLSDLAREAGGNLVGGDPEITGLAIDSRQVQSGQLFVAVAGARANGLDFVPDAQRNGAAAICAPQAVVGIPTLVTDDPRRALARLAAAFHGHPARELTLVGVTGSLGKTSSALLIEAALTAAGRRPGVIGSLGIRFDGTVVQTGMTTPDAPAIHAALRRMVTRGATHAVMEVTSHSLRLQRVDGLEFDIGVFTNLVPDEHLEFHASADDYVRTKLRFLELLRPGAPLVANMDDQVVRGALAARIGSVAWVSLHGRADATVGVEGLVTTAAGSRFLLRVKEALSRIDGSSVEPSAIPLFLPLLGRTNVANAALASTAALIAGAGADAVRAALAATRPMHRRLQIVFASGPIVLDDTVGNPISVRAVFEVAPQLPHERLRVVYGIRGSRGTAINERNAVALADGVRDTNAELVVTSSEDAANEANVVTSEEREAVLDTLRARQVSFEHEPTLERAVRRVLESSTAADLVLLLGAQGMDRAGDFVRRHFGVDRRRSRSGRGDAGPGAAAPPS
ncbi:MAG TPA: Mur ligase family protein [Gemmatimonadaceae bacterium]|nr:Mur ligase family protein [Gemmatimonadaceae bacterium]